MKSKPCVSLFNVIFIILVFQISTISPVENNNSWKFLSRRNADTREWWEKTVFYQIYPRSFKDSDGDGIGDLIGIRNSLKHLADIGVYATWLSPIFESPMVDFGYDCSNFRKIDPIFGSMDDFEKLIEEANRLGIKIILDFVPNHTSDQHEWFTKSENGEPGYEDFYVWRNSSVNGQKALPNNWVSVFSGPSWTWSEKRQQFYYHQFAKQQPDLNYRNERVVDEMIKILDFWIEKGVYGFRVDAINHMYEDSLFRDDIQIGTDPLNHDHFEHPYTKDLPESNEMIYKWRSHFEIWSKTNNKENILLMTEAYTSRENIMTWYQNKNGSRKGSHIPFNFIFIMELTAESKPSDFKKSIDDWIRAVPAGQNPNWVMGNHDRSRAGTRFGKSFVDSINIIALTLPGFAITYYGEEIGMVNIPHISWQDTQDPQGCLTNPEVYEKYSRDPVRSPFQWDATVNAGFSNSTKKPWLPIHPDYKSNNLASQISTEHSHYSIYKQLTYLRQHPTLIASNFQSIVLNNDSVFAFKRFLENSTTFYMVINFDYKLQTVNLRELGSNDNGIIEVSGVNSKLRNGEVINLHDLQLGGYEALIIRSAAIANVMSISTMLVGIFSTIRCMF